MRISSGVIAAALIAWAQAAAAQQPAAPPSAPAAHAALERGFGAYRSGRQESALAALSEAATTGGASAKFFAEFYLARMYSENVGPAGDHTKAFMLFRKLADENLSVDPETSQRAPFVAKALIALAGYVRAGIEEIDLAPNARRAADYLHHAAVFFGDKDAQFELARLYLNSDGSKDDIRRGLHYLSVLSEESYPAAQALLADLFWRGRYVKKDDRRALALATMAAESAPAHERIWIEETYAAVFCATAQATREAAGDLVAWWRKTFAQPAPYSAVRLGPEARELLSERQCGNGEKVALGPPRSPADAPPAKADATAAGPPAAIARLKGAAAPFGFRAAGIMEAATKK